MIDCVFELKNIRCGIIEDIYLRNYQSMRVFFIFVFINYLLLGFWVGVLFQVILFRRRFWLYFGIRRVELGFVIKIDDRIVFICRKVLLLVFIIYFVFILYFCL